MTQSRATLLGFGAVLLWSTLALFTATSAPIPPFQLTAMTFAVGGTLGLLWSASRGTLAHLTRVPIKVYAFGTIGLFGYHALYFAALRLAPPAQAGLVAYLWPLLIVLFSGLLPGETLKRGHIIGASLGFAGAALLVVDTLGPLSSKAPWGLAIAFLCALTWSGYSVLSRRFKDAPTDAVGVYCLASSALAIVAHLAFEISILPSTTNVLSVLGLGLGPVGLAFFVWDIGVKQGNIAHLGTLSYAAPILSTGLLVIFGISAATLSLAGATILIALGAFVAAKA